MQADEISKDAVGLRLARIDNRENLILCEAVRFVTGRPAVVTTLRRAELAGRVEVDGKIKNHFADVLNDSGDLIGTVALDRDSYSSLKNHWMRCKVERSPSPRVPVFEEMAKPTKLSKPQLDLLTEAVAAGKATCVEGYPPRRKLVALGLVTEHEGRTTTWIQPTDDGYAVHRSLTS